MRKGQNRMFLRSAPLQGLCPKHASAEGVLARTRRSAPLQELCPQGNVRHERSECARAVSKFLSCNELSKHSPLSACTLTSDAFSWGVTDVHAKLGVLTAQHMTCTNGKDATNGNACCQSKFCRTASAQTNGERRQRNSLGYQPSRYS